MASSIKNKINGIAILAAALPVVILTLIILYEKNVIQADIEAGVNNLRDAEMEQIVDDVYSMCSMLNEMTMMRCDVALNVMDDIVQRSGGLKISSPNANWELFNQETQETTTVSLPTMYLGNQPIKYAKSFSDFVPVLDRVQKTNSGVSSIFQKINDKGDMLRVATTVPAKDGSRAIGSFIPAVSKAGVPNKVISKILAGGIYVGTAFVVDKMYVAKYQPLKDNSGKIIGMIAVAFEQEPVSSFREALYNTVVGRSGYVYIIGGNGDDKGHYIVSKEGKSDGKDIWEVFNTGRYVIQEIVEKAVKLEGNAKDSIQYFWQNADEKAKGVAPREKVVFLGYFEPWDWVIGAGTYQDDFHEIESLRAGMNEILIYSVIGGIIVLVLMILLAIIVGRKISQPIIELTGVAEKFRQGDLSFRIDVESNDEAGVLAQAFKSMAENFKGMITEINQLSDDCQRGKLDRRAEASKYEGEYGTLVGGINNTLDAVIRPLNVTAEYVDRISKGDIPEKITDHYRGDFNEIKNNINQLIDVLNSFITDMGELENQQSAGDVDFFIDDSQYQGSFMTMASGVNSLVRMMIDDLKHTVDIVQSYGDGDFMAQCKEFPGKKAEITKSLNNVQNNLNDIALELGELIDAAADGKLSQRGDPDKFKGGWAEIVSGVNEIFTSITEPIEEATRILEKMAEGNLSIRMEGNYKGDHSKIKEALNKTLDLMPFQEAIAVLQELAEGDLRVKMTGDYKGDSLAMKEALNKSVVSMHDILQQVRQIVEEVQKGAMQVSDASTALSQGATEQAASLEEITSSMSEIGSQTKFNAENASQANAITIDARENAASGNKEMAELNQAMSDINESSNNISKIIKVIEEIAFQTNLLALNAAVEAARAGRHGKGFAVVAEEVRNLAARSATAAKETAEMIENSMNVVERGSALASRTNDALTDIQNGSIKAADIVSEIATSSNEQAQGISQINEGLTQIDKVTQTNTASAEQSASAAEELSGQATNLKRMVEKFKLNEDEMGDYDSNDDEEMALGSNQNARSLPGKIEPNPKDVISLDEDDFGKY